MSHQSSIAQRSLLDLETLPCAFAIAEPMQILHELAQAGAPQEVCGGLSE
jgi:hypothetical protein